MKLFCWILLSFSLMCSNNSGYSGGETAKMESADVFYESEPIATRTANMPVAEPQEQKIIKESFLKFETKDLNKTYKDIISYTQNNGGYIQSDESGKGYQQLTRNLVIKIPSQNFQKILDSISKDVVYFDVKRISSKDVTEEFIDIEARLKAKLALEERYTQLLSKANSVKDILEIERELSNIREDIEAQEGRLKYLSNRVAYSTFNIEFYKTTAETGVTVSYATKMWNAIKAGFDGISLFFLGLLHIWPFILILCIIVIVIRRKFFKKRKKSDEKESK